MWTVQAGPEQFILQGYGDSFDTLREDHKKEVMNHDYQIVQQTLRRNHLDVTVIGVELN